jgi:hypothetical protein
MSKTQKTDWAYMAGIMDGEGSFSISKCTIHSKSGKPYLAYDNKILVGNTSEVLLKWIVEHFGGQYRIASNYLSKVRGKDQRAKSWNAINYKICYRWTCEGYRKQEQFLLALIPYLVIKKEQAKVSLEWTRMVNAKNPAKRLELHQRMIALNKGSSPTTNTPNIEIKQYWEFPTFTEVLNVNSMKIESELHGDMQSVPLVTATT